MSYNKSYLKWAGSKNKALAHLLPILEKHKQTNFVEPFVGAANVSLNFDAKRYLWNDLNGDLVNSHEQVFRCAEYYAGMCVPFFEKGFDCYYEYREWFNERKEGNMTMAVLFQYLNKHGFNGLCRYNKKGEFNVPQGTVTKNPKKDPNEQIKFFRDRFNSKTSISNIDYVSFMDNMEHINECLVYCDPPYVPMGESNFKYTANGFSSEDQTKLRDLAKKSRHTVIISNHWNKITKELYKDADEVYTFPVNRTISCKSKERLPVEECVVVYRGNYV